MEFLNTDSLETAREKLLSSVGGGLVSEETVTLDGALGRIAARDLYAGVDIPAFRRSAVDGYAVRAAETSAAGESIPVFLTLKGCVDIGKPSPFSISGGECAEVPTGGMLPDGADAAVMVENTEKFGESGIAVGKSIAYGENVILAGDDAKAGDKLLSRGKCILPQDMGALAAAGITALSVYTRPRVAILSSGDELVPPEKTPAPGEIRDINTYALTALARKTGFDVTHSSILPDDEKILTDAVQLCMKENEIVIMSGGSSKGKKDLTKSVFDTISSGGVFTHGIAVQPGKPTVLGYDNASRTLLAGLPGHPVSAMTVFDLLLAWLLRKVTGNRRPPAIPARLSCNIASSPGRFTCRPCKLIYSSGGYIAEPIFGSSGLITTLTRADGYFTVPRDTEGLTEGQTVSVYLYS